MLYYTLYIYTENFCVIVNHIYKEIRCIVVLNKKMSFFFFYKIGEQEVLSGGWYQGGEEEVGKGCKRLNMLQIMCTRVCMYTCAHLWQNLPIWLLF
jgi:hypothetical protein